MVNIIRHDKRRGWQVLISTKYRLDDTLKHRSPRVHSLRMTLNAIICRSRDPSRDFARNTPTAGATQTHSASKVILWRVL